MGNYMGHGAGSPAVCLASPGNSYAYWDDAYVDTTRAHVEIGDAPTYAACTQREIQIPTSWNSTSITVTANRGAFGGLPNTYLYVTDRNGAVNIAGYKLGSSGDVIGPDSIQDLRPK